MPHLYATFSQFSVFFKFFFRSEDVILARSKILRDRFVILNLLCFFPWRRFALSTLVPMFYNVFPRWLNRRDLPKELIDEK